MMRYILLLIFVVFIIPLPAWAQLTGSDTAPGDSCAGFPTGATRMSADADQDGGSVILVCDGTDWTAQSTGGGGGMTVTNPEDCDEGESPVWNSGSSEFRCPLDATPDPFDFIDNENVDSDTSITSNIELISGIDSSVNITISGDGNPEYRSCSDSNCSTVINNWASSGLTVSNNEYLQIRTTSPATYGVVATVNINVGTSVDSWSVETGNLDEDFESCSIDTNNFSFSGNQDWFATSFTANTGSCSAQSGPIGGNQQSVMSTTIETTAGGTLSYAIRVESEGCCDRLIVRINGSVVRNLGGNVAWNTLTESLSNGTNTIEWIYDKDGSVDQGEDAAWIDDITFTPN